MSFFGPKYPTKLWARANDLQLDFDLELGSLNGVRLGDPLEAISFLGPVEDLRQLQDREYSYSSLGLSIGCDECMVDSFEIVQHDYYSPLFGPYSGQLHW